MRRVEVETNEQLCATLFYIHKNPIHHGLCKSFEDWHWSLYHAFKRPFGETSLKRDEGLEWFGGVEAFIDYHG